MENLPSDLDSPEEIKGVLKKEARELAKAMHAWNTEVGQANVGNRSENQEIKYEMDEKMGKYAAMIIDLKVNNPKDADFWVEYAIKAFKKIASKIFNSSESLDYHTFKIINAMLDLALEGSKKSETRSRIERILQEE